MKDGFYDLYCEEITKNEKLLKKYEFMKASYSSEKRRNDYLEEHMKEMIEKGTIDKITELEKENDALRNEVARLKGILNKDGTNSGIPTSQTPLNKNKRVPNSRVKTGKKKGGQLKHKGYKLASFAEDEITNTIEHKIDICPNCGKKMISTGKIVNKDEYELKFIVEKRRHQFIETICEHCGTTEIVSIPTELKEANQYGKHIQALALTLMNEGYVSIQRTSEIISGLSQGEINLSEGYVAKIQKRLSGKLDNFVAELKREVIGLPVLHWDDTVIYISTNRACLRFYGNEQYALYVAHMKKDKEGLDEDNILNSLDENTVVVHDHNIINYNEEYEFQNAECCTHLLRDLKKVVDNIPGREWPKEMISLLVEENIKRNDKQRLDVKRIESIYDELVKEGREINKASEDQFYISDEKTLINRLEKYKDNYLLWTLNDEVPFTNNVSERSLRGSKTKMKISGQFDNLKRAQDFANIKSYIETGKRFGFNPTELIVRALSDDYITVQQMKEHDVQFQ